MVAPLFVTNEINEHRRRGLPVAARLVATLGFGADSTSRVLELHEEASLHDLTIAAGSALGLEVIHCTIDVGLLAAHPNAPLGGTMRTADSTRFRLCDMTGTTAEARYATPGSAATVTIQVLGHAPYEGARVLTGD